MTFHKFGTYVTTRKPIAIFLNQIKDFIENSDNCQLQGTHCTGKTGKTEKMAKKRKHREFGNFNTGN